MSSVTTFEMLLLGGVGGFLVGVLLDPEVKCAPCPVCGALPPSPTDGTPLGVASQSDGSVATLYGGNANAEGATFMPPATSTRADSTPSGASPLAAYTPSSSSSSSPFVPGGRSDASHRALRDEFASMPPSASPFSGSSAPGSSTPGSAPFSGSGAPGASPFSGSSAPQAPQGPQGQKTAPNTVQAEPPKRAPAPARVVPIRARRA